MNRVNFNNPTCCRYEVGTEGKERYIYYIYKYRDALKYICCFLAQSCLTL